MSLSSRCSYVCDSCVRRLTASLAQSRRTISLVKHSRQSRSFTASTRQSRPFRVAVIGSGPAGFYSSHRLLQKLDDAVVDMYEHLPVPFGLVRFGVAPDHPEVKNCQDKFEEVASSPRFNYIGNVDVGRELPLTVMLPHYDAFLFSYGASRDRELGIEGENLRGVYSARAFVGWYNGLPQYANLDPDLETGDTAFVVGQGNVALDVARILLTDIDVLRKTDIAEHALEKLSRNRVKRVEVVGRRGPVQAPFTIKEVRELMNIPTVGFRGMDPANLLPEDPKILNRPQKRIADLLKKHSNLDLRSDASKSWMLRFLLAPSKLSPSRQDSSRLGRLTFNRTQFVGEGAEFDTKASVVSTDDSVSFDASLAFRSIGYKSEPLPGFPELGIHFDQKRGIIPNIDGRVSTITDGKEDHVPGMYCAGWVKRGPTGVIASTMDDAFMTAENIVMDRAKQGYQFLNGEIGTDGFGDGSGWDSIRRYLDERGHRPVSWKEWKVIDQVEKKTGEAKGKEREKVPDIEGMLKILDG